MCGSIQHSVRFVGMALAVALCGTPLWAGGNESGVAGDFTTGPADFERFVSEFCLDCHDSVGREAGLALDELVEGLGEGAIARNTAVWERVVRKLTARQMPPLDMP